MNLEERVQQLENELRTIKQALSPEMVATLTDRIFPRTVGVTDANADLVVNVSGGTGSVTVLDFPDRWVVVNLEGKEYLLAAYDLSRL